MENEQPENEPQEKTQRWQDAVEEKVNEAIRAKVPAEAYLPAYLVGKITFPVRRGKEGAEAPTLQDYKDNGEWKSLAASVCTGIGAATIIKAVVNLIFRRPIL